MIFVEDIYGIYSNISLSNFFFHNWSSSSHEIFLAAQRIFFSWIFFKEIAIHKLPINFYADLLLILEEV